MARRDAAQPQPLAVALHPPQTRLAAIEGQHQPLIAHCLGQVGALAAGGGAGIEQPLPGLGIEQGHDPLGAAVLHAPVALGVAGQLAQIAAAAADHEAPGQTLDGGGRQARGAERLQHLLAAGAQAVHAQIQAWRGVAGGAEGFGPLGRQPGQQIGGQPVRQGVAQGQGRRRIGGLRQRITGLAPAQEGPQQAVHHRRQPCQPALLGQLHRGAHSRGSWHPLTEQQLIEAQMQQPAQLRRLAFRRHLAQLIEPGVEPAPLADGAVGQLGGQGPIERAERRAPQLPLQGPIGVGPCRHGLQHLPGHPPRRQAGAACGGGGRGLAVAAVWGAAAQGATSAVAPPQLAPGRQR